MSSQCLNNQVYFGRLQRDATSQLDVPSFVDVREMKVVKKGGNFFKENTNQDQEVFADLNDQFRFNVTNDYIIISNLESSVKYKVELQAVNQQTSSQIVTKQRFTGRLIVSFLSLAYSCVSLSPVFVILVNFSAIRKKSVEILGW